MLVLGAVAILELGMQPGGAAETNAPLLTNAAPLANRYLLVLETSHSMERRSEGTLKALQRLLGPGMGGQLRRGDTLAIWTYNEQLHAGQFPLQHWTPESHRLIFSRALSFFQAQKYEKDGLFQVMPALDRLIKGSPFLTIILVSGGEQKIHGTPYDDPINQAYDLWKKEQRDAHMPFITILRAKGGQINSYSVNPAQWAVEMPPLPQELQVVAIPEKKQAAPAKPAPPIGQSLYLSGKKSQPQDKPAPAVTNAVPASQPTPIPPEKPTTAIEPDQRPTNSSIAPEFAKPPSPLIPLASLSQAPGASAEKPLIPDIEPPRDQPPVSPPATARIFSKIRLPTCSTDSVPSRMVLLSPWLDLGMTNPNIAFVQDPLLPLGPAQQIGRIWAGNLAINDPMVSPLYGSLAGLPPTYVYSGNLDILSPDVFRLQDFAVVQNAPISFVLANGQIHDWLILTLDGLRYWPQINQELGIAA